MKVLAVVLVSGFTRLEFGASLRKQSFTVNLQNFGGLLRRVKFVSKFKGDLLRLRFCAASRAIEFCFRLRQFWALFPASIYRHLDANAEHVISAELSGIGALPCVLEIKVRVEILVGKIDLQVLLFDDLVRARNLRVISLRVREELIKCIWQRRIGQLGRFYIGRGLRAIEKLLDLRLRLCHFEMVHGDFTEQFGLFKLCL